MTQRRWFGLRAGASNWLWLALVVMLLDQWTKYLVTDNLDEFEQIVLLPVLELMRLHNEGAAFSLFSTAISVFISGAAESESASKRAMADSTASE